MHLYLVRHGEAQADDPLKPLSGHGRREAEKVASHLSFLEVHCIFHSAKLRAAQTAEVFTEYVEPDEGPTEAEGLAPLDDPRIWESRLEAMDADIMLVGHLPYMSRLASLLLTGNPDLAVFEFPASGVLCLRREKGSWALRWMIGPELVR